MARCDACGFDWQAMPEELIEEIGGFGPAYRSCITSGLDVEDAEVIVRTRPSPEIWSAVEYTAHMRDVAHFYVARIERVVAEDRPTMVAADFASMVDTRSYRDQDVAAVLDELDGLALAAARRLESLTEVEWARVGIGSEGGERTVLVLARRLAHDGHHHLGDVGQVLRHVRNRR